MREVRKRLADDVVPDTVAFLESARKIVKTSIDLIRLAAYPDAK